MEKKEKKISVRINIYAVGCIYVLYETHYIKFVFGYVLKNSSLRRKSQTATIIPTLYNGKSLHCAFINDPFIALIVQIL